MLRGNHRESSWQEDNVNGRHTGHKCDKLYLQGEVRVTALRNVTLTIQRGEFVSLFGPSGSGKSTLLNLVGGLDVPSEGEIWVGDTCLSALKRGERASFRLRHLGFVFQSF